MASQKHALSIRFDTQDELRREYASNMVNGGIFVPTRDTIKLRAPVRVGIELTYCGKALTLAGEVVHSITPELAAAGAVPGVAVQFDVPADQLREMLEPFVGDVEVGQEGAGDEQKRASRTRARVGARLRSADGETECRTRNISSTGMLVSVPGEPVPVGTRVVLILSHPETGAEIEVEGKVARHIAGEDGIVSALGIHFTPAREREEAVKSFIERLQASEHSRHLGGISGAIEELGVENLLQTFGSSAPEGTLTLMRAAQEGFVVFEQGYLLVAHVGAAEGIKALARMLSWPDGRFEFHASLGPDVSRDDPVVLDSALTDAIAEMEECGRVDQSRFSAEALLGSGAPMAQFDSDATKLETAILDLAAVGMSVQRVLDIVPEPDSEIYLALSLLLELDLIRIHR